LSSGIDALAGRALARAGVSLLTWGRTRVQRANVRDNARTWMPLSLAQLLAHDLEGERLQQVWRYIASAEFDEVALQIALGVLLDDKDFDEFRSGVRHQIQQGLRHLAALPPELLMRVADLIFEALYVSAEEIAGRQSNKDSLDSRTAATVAHLTSAAARNGELLRQLAELDRHRELGREMRNQVRQLHANFRMPHAGISRSVPYEKLYVEPPLLPYRDGPEPPPIDLLGTAGLRTVVLGSPGAGKSTLMGKLAHDVATGRIEGAEQRVPFLAVLRNLTEAFAQGDRSLTEHLQAVCHAPYNVEVTADTVRYLLATGQALVLLDGLDELVDTALRTRVVQLIEGFVYRYPLVPLVVTSRIVGYELAPLDDRLFRVVQLGDFDDERVDGYTRKWFAMDDATPVHERDRLAEAFLRESRSAAELRQSPLLLSLLCAMYSSEHYIPRNLAKVYERCATMLFDQWDSMRGITMPLQFQGRVRYAMQFLAWKQLTTESGPQPRHRVEATLTDYLVDRRLDHDEARAMAADFLAFCTGRAWILTDVGSNLDEPMYDFTHRTFMEFFAAEHLVRTQRTAPAVIDILRPHLEVDTWEVVGEIAAQLVDQRVEGGAEELVQTILISEPEDPARRSSMLAFAARLLAHVSLSPESVAAVIDAMLERVLRLPIEARCSYWPDGRLYEQIRIWDLPLYRAMYSCSPENLSYMRRAILNRLGVAISDRHPVAEYIAYNLSRHLVREDGVRADHWAAAGRELAETFRPGSPLSPLLRPNAAWPTRAANYYLSDACLTGVTYPDPIYLLSGDAEAQRSTILSVRDQLIHTPLPWLPRGKWFEDLAGSSGIQEMVVDILRSLRWPVNAEEQATFLILCLPYLETALEDTRLWQIFRGIEGQLEWLMHSRATTDGIQPPMFANFPDDGREFLSAWMRGATSVFAE